MNSLAEVHLRQARAFLRTGDPQRAVELLEKARALARDDQQMLPEILEALALAYQNTGATDKAAKSLAQLGRLGHRTTGGDMRIPGPGNPGRRGIFWFAATAAAAILLAIGIIIVMRHKSSAPSASGPATRSATLPTDHMVAATAKPKTFAATTRAVRVTPLANRVDVRPNVALLVLLGRYEGLANGQHLQVFVPLSSAAAFVVKPAGILLTVRHLTHRLKENNFPSTLESLKLPTLTLRQISYVLCFSANSSDWVDARLLYESEQFDIAVLGVDRHFAAALDCNGRDAVRGEILDAWQYPGVLTFDNHYENPARVEEMIQNLPQTTSANLLAAVAPECFTAVKIPEAVTIPERNVDGTACVELASRPAADNGGGPIVDRLGHVIAIAEPSAKQPLRAIGILVNQLQDEIAPYLAPAAATSSSDSASQTNPKTAYN